MNFKTECYEFSICDVFTLQMTARVFGFDGQNINVMQ